jgi:hypothetical protein
MDNPPTYSSHLQRVPTDDRDDRLERVEQALSLLADQLAVLTTTSPPVHGTPIDPVVPDQYEDVPVIPVRNRCYAVVLAVKTTTACATVRRDSERTRCPRQLMWPAKSAPC